VLQVMPLNDIKIKHPASQIVAIDWSEGRSGGAAIG